MRADSACQGVRAAAAAEEEDGAEGAEMTLARPRARREVMCDRAWMTFVRVFASSSMRFKLRACNEVFPELLTLEVYILYLYFFIRGH